MSYRNENTHVNGRTLERSIQKNVPESGAHNMRSSCDSLRLTEGVHGTRPDSDYLIFKSSILFYGICEFLLFSEKGHYFSSILAVVLKSRPDGFRASIRNFGHLNVKTERILRHKQNLDISFDFNFMDVRRMRECAGNDSQNDPNGVQYLARNDSELRSEITALKTSKPCKTSATSLQKF